MIVAFSEIFLTKPSSRKVCRKVGYSIEVMQTVTGLGRWNRETERGGTDPRVFSIGPQRVRCTRVSASFQVTGGGPSLTTQIRDYADFLPGVKRRRQMVCVCVRGFIRNSWHPLNIALRGCNWLKVSCRSLQRFLTSSALRTSSCLSRAMVWNPA